jgi:hypothetical protein
MCRLTYQKIMDALFRIWIQMFKFLSISFHIEKARVCSRQPWSKIAKNVKFQPPPPKNRHPFEFWAKISDMRSPSLRKWAYQISSKFEDSDHQSAAMKWKQRLFLCIQSTKWLALCKLIFPDIPIKIDYLDKIFYANKLKTFTSHCFISSLHSASGK